MAQAAEHRFVEPEVVRLFPTFVWKARLPPAQRDSINSAIRETLAQLRRDLPELARGENWQSGHGLHRTEALRGLVARLESAANTVLEFLKIGYDALRITGCWATVSAPGAAHRMHSHPNNFLSGVYYVQVGEGANTINFHDPRPQSGIMRPPVTELTAYNTDQVVVRVEEGVLLLFPSWLPHSVDANASDRLRISVSFNLMFSGYAEHLSSPLWGGQ
jgi:uncharacterized protein (TIGR02466 family)